MTDPTHTCPRCAVTYRPARTDLACPVCRTPAPGHVPEDDVPGLDLRVLLVGVSAVDFLALALVAWWLLG